MFWIMNHAKGSITDSRVNNNDLNFPNYRM